MSEEVSEEINMSEPVPSDWRCPPKALASYSMDPAKIKINLQDTFSW
jgi:hypothetical protein